MKLFKPLLAILLTMISFGADAFTKDPDSFIKGLTLDYYLPYEAGYTYDGNIPTPKDFLGFEIGQQHVTYDQAIAYMQLLASKSEKVKCVFNGRSYEYRPMMFVQISSPENLSNLEFIRQENLKLCDISGMDEVDTKKLPIVTYLAYSVHGNEASGINASLAVAYFLTAAQGEQIDRLLSEMVIIMQPGQNPDGIQKYATWVNSSRSFTAVLDNQSREFREPSTPSSRSNHYWFDLNRDWFFAQHPETYYKLQFYHLWNPAVVSDYHEHGTIGLAYFSPGIPTSIDRNIPVENYGIQNDFARYHADTLQSIGVPYFSKEGYDSFYTSKGAAFPQLFGGIGMLFEQPNPKGHIQIRSNEQASLAESTRNQAFCSYSTLTGALEMREKIFEYRKNSYREAAGLAKKDPVKGYIFGEDPSIDSEFARILFIHNIEVYRLKKDTKLQNKSFTTEYSYVIPTDQQNYRLIKSMFDVDKEYIDSTFYDISTWTLPLSFNVNYVEASTISGLLGDRVHEISPLKKPSLERSDIGYLFDSDDFYSYKLIYNLLSEGVRLKVSPNEFHFQVSGGERRKFKPGTIILSVSAQSVDSDRIYRIINDFVEDNNTPVFSLTSGISDDITLGSRTFREITLPRVALITGAGATAGTLGEIWYLFDQKFQIPVTLLESTTMGSVDLDRYNIIVMCGNYDLSSAGEKKVTEWSRKQGNYIIGMTTAINTMNKLGLSKIELKDGAASSRAANRIRGIILEARINKNSPLSYGIRSETIPFFKNNNTFLAEKKGVNAPFIYTDKTLLSGCVTPDNLEILKNTPAVVKERNVIYFSNPPFFRGHWYGSVRTFMNAVFFREL